MKTVIKFDHRYTDSGSTSATSWARLVPDLRKHFNCGPDEVITGIEVDENGITARFVVVKK